MQIKVITIDFWNTLFDSSGGSERNKFRLKNLITQTDKLGYFIKKDDIENSLKASWEYFNSIWVNQQRTPSSVELVEFLWKYLKLPYVETTIFNIADAFANSVLEYPPSLISGAKEALIKLSSNYKLGIVSDTGFSPGVVLRQLLEREGILKYFDEFSFSDETGVSKPNKIAFLTILNKLNCKPSEALHIGDIEATDIKGSVSLGMRAIRFSGDPNSFITKEIPEKTNADVDCKNWGDVLLAIDRIKQT